MGLRDGQLGLCFPRYLDHRYLWQKKSAIGHFPPHGIVLASYWFRIVRFTPLELFS